nr:hypothetical protein [Pseudomonadota bacterium]
MGSVAEYFDTMDYAPALEGAGEARAWLATHSAGFGHFIGGAWVGAGRGDSFATYEPATGEV